MTRFAVDGGPFVVVGDPKAEHLKSFWYKERCKLCGDLFQLCPPKKNLEGNLKNHLQGLKHCKVVEDAASGARSGSLALSTGRRGRPSAATRAVLGAQPGLHEWFKVFQATRSSPSESTVSGERDGTLSLLCWGFRDKSITYAGKLYNIQGLLNDPKSGRYWVPEPATRAEFEFHGEFVHINGCFRHTNCKRLCGSFDGFLNFTCSECSQIPKLNDFTLRVIREGHSLQKRGSRSILPGRRVDYLSTKELASHRRQLSKKLKEYKNFLWQVKARVAQVKMSKQGLKLSAVESFNRKDVLAFCNNILAAHKTNAFGGKPAFWDFLRDVASNINRSKKGYRFSKNTKSVAQAMKIYGGQRMCDLFSLNFAGPSYNTIRRENRKGVRIGKAFSS
jgi:hypothetical protein